MMMRVSQRVEQMADVGSTPATYAASAASVLFGLTVGEWQAIGVIGGLVLGALTLATSMYFKHKHLQIARKENR